MEMTEHKWTPGKWRVERDEYSGIEKYGVYAIDETPVVSHFTAIEHEHDAHLIAAAPDLYEALEYMRDAGCPHCNGDCASANPPVAACPMRRACAALAKARGETQ